jgi:hypothetical protein
MVLQPAPQALVSCRNGPLASTVVRCRWYIVVTQLVTRPAARRIIPERSLGRFRCRPADVASSPGLVPTASASASAELAGHRQ